jgi:hypothetical protein
MRKDFIIGIAATLIAMAAFYFYDQVSLKKNNKTEPTEVAEDLEKIQTDSAAAASSDVSSGDKTVAKALDTSAGEPAKPEDVQQVYKNFSEHLKTMGTCLEIKNAVDSDKVDPTYDNLVVSLRPALGEVVVQMDDWTQRDLRNAQGDRKRLRTESNYDNGAGSPTKRVQLYKINEQGMPELQAIDQEQSVNPSDAYIDSLKGDFETSLEEKGARAYYQEGEEVVMIERNGKLESVSITRNGKTASCTGLDSLKSNCQCL